MKRKMHFGMRMSVVVLCAAVLLASQAQAAYMTWNTTYDSGTYEDAFSNGAYWGGTAPGADDCARWTGDPVEITAKLDGDVTHYALRNQAAGGYITIDLNGFTHTVTSTSTSDTFFDYGTIEVTNSGATGASNIAYLTVGRSSGTDGTLKVTGSSTVLNITGSDRNNIGGSGNGELVVSGGAKLTNAGELSFGYNGAANGVGTITGSGSSVELDGNAIIAYKGTAAVTISDGGKLVTSGGNAHLRVGLVDGASGQLLITGANSLAEGSRLGIGGNDASRGGTGSITVSDGGSLVSRSIFDIWDESSLTIDGGTVTSGGSLRLRDGSTLSLVLNDLSTLALVQALSNLEIESAAQLQLALGQGASFSPMDFIPLISYSGNLSGQFSNYQEGQQVTLGGQDFEFTYVGGTGKTVGLTAVPEPAVSSVLMIGAALVARRRRK